ncbi:MAG TPA: hypothetical protein VF950_00410 [Planctomycetota bacterium]
MRFLALLLPLALAACENPPKVMNPDSPSTVGALHADLPAPNGFVYVKNVGDTNPTGAFRVLTQVLEGKQQRVEAAVKFYKEAFPAHGWALEGEEGSAKDAIRLSFLKKEERCRVEIKDTTRELVTSTVKVTRKD